MLHARDKPIFDIDVFPYVSGRPAATTTIQPLFFPVF